MGFAEALKGLARRAAGHARLKSPWIIHYDCGSCNGCDIELLACLTPTFDAERLGVVNVGNPKHADILVVTGAVNRRNSRVLENLYREMGHPKAVVAVGTCAASGGLFRDCPNVIAGVDQVVPVTVYVPGCPARPQDIMAGIQLAALRLAGEETRETAAEGAHNEAERAIG